MTESQVVLPSSLGPFRILSELGIGSFAHVYRAYDEKNQRVVALKILHPFLLRDPVSLGRFIREGEVVSSLRHPYIVSVFEAGQISGRSYISMALIEGETLETRLQRRGALPFDEVLTLLKPLCEALDYTHAQGVIHRDLKPANILLDAQDKPHLADFGVVSLLGHETAALTISASLVGTYQYLAPEIWNEGTPSPRSDLYALGCIAYELVMGVPLVPRRSLIASMRAHLRQHNFPEVWPDGVSSGATAAFKKALASKPRDRYSSAMAFWDALSQKQLPRKRETKLLDRLRSKSANPPSSGSPRPIPPEISSEVAIQKPPVILLVEDEPDVLIILHRLMRALTDGWDIHTVGGGRDALAWCTSRSVSLVITDYNMPGMNGVQLTSAIKEMSPDIPVVMITAYATPELEKRAHEAGVDYFLPKPFPLDRMEQIVRITLGGR